jgi:hypothetical protein
MKKTPEKKAAKPAVKYPLFKISRNGESYHLLIVGRSVADTLTKAQTIWTRKKHDAPKSVNIEMFGTVDYIPALKKPHWEA